MKGFCDSVRAPVGPLLLAVLLLAGLLLSACGSAPPAPVETPPLRSAADVELTLNLPEEPASCVCEVEAAEDRTFLERGVETLAGGDYIEAVQYFKRYRRLEPTALAQWEADLAIAYVSMLPRSPFYDVEAAGLAFTDLQTRAPDGQLHHTIVLMRQALESFLLMDRHVNDLQSRTNMLQEDLDKREQALKRLRELTLRQPADAP
jgi:tetratricopeptide (TPR) repeat protein